MLGVFFEYCFSTVYPSYSFSLPMFHAMFHFVFLGVMFYFVLKEVRTFSSFIDWGVGGSSVFLFFVYVIFKIW